MPRSIEKEDYLETMFELKQKHGYIRISDIAKALNLKLPSVTQMMQRLEKEGYVSYKAYGPIELTQKGQGVAKHIANRHEVLHEFLTVLGVPESIQKKDIHGIEHHLSRITVDRLKTAIDFLKNHKFS